MKPAPAPQRGSKSARATRSRSADRAAAGARLARYRAKRDFSRTPEPAGAGATAGQRYVIHKHWARNLHYDLRLEVNGAMRSWAVPKGPSLDPADRRLAVEVEDHPIDYNDFEGQIPAGQYGAGRVIIWDRGTWTAEDDAAEGFRAGHVKFSLFGQKLTGAWALVRMRDRNARQPPWLLIKERDAAARPAGQFDVTAAKPDSVGPASAAAAANARTRAARSPAAHSTQAPAARRPRRKSHAQAALPEALAPQLARQVDAPPADADNWLWEIKFDGYRLLARIGAHGAVRLMTRNGLDWSDRMPELARAVAALELPGTWLDGEVVMPGERNVPDFAALQRAFAENRTAQLVYYLFDAPYLAGADLRARPLAERREQLEKIEPAFDATGPLRLSAALGPDPASLLASACRMGLEGIMGKRRDARYQSGRSADWIKLKCWQEDEFVIVGFTAGEGTRAASAEPGALVLAAHDAGGRLRWAGNAGSSFSAAAFADLQLRFTPLRQAASPLAAGEKVPSRMQWLRPELVAQVRHAGLTPSGHVRQAVFRGLREDKAAADVTLPPHSGKKPHSVERSMRMKSDGQAPAAASRRQPANLAGRKLTHPDRVIDTESGSTKLDLARYYAAVAPLILPHLARRPVALLRAPDGVAGEKFFQKHTEGRQLPGVTLLDPGLDPGHAALLVIGDEAALLGAVQMNAVELHTWNATADRIERPDRFVLDLDPGEGVEWPQVQQAAELARTLLTELGLVPFIKTSGGKGLHLVTPIKRLYDWDTVKTFSRQLTEHLAALMPDRFVAVSGPKNRVGRIYADYLRNGRGATTVAAWSARARPGMGVSVPFAWDELARVSGGAHWHIGNVQERLSVGDGPWSAYARAARALGPALKTMAQRS